MRWQGRVRRAGWMVQAAWLDIVWVLVAFAATLWGWVGPAILPHANPCSGDHGTFVVAMAVHVALIVAAVTLTVVRSARLGASGGTTSLILAAILIPWGAGTLYLWLATGVCWNLTM